MQHLLLDHRLPGFDANGDDASGRVVARHDYLPFGEEVGSNAGRDSSYGISDNINQKFTGQERDSETGLDFFNARFMSSVQGRFLSPDPFNAGANASDPQSWNGYAYVRGNPLALVDPSGMEDRPTFSSTTKLCGWWQVWCYLGAEGYGEDPGLSSGWDFTGVGFPPLQSNNQQQSFRPQPPKNGNTFTKVFLPQDLYLSCSVGNR